MDFAQSPTTSDPLSYPGLLPFLNQDIQAKKNSKPSVVVVRTHLGCISLRCSSTIHLAPSQQQQGTLGTAYVDTLLVAQRQPLSLLVY